MKETTLELNRLQTATQPLATFGSSHGYRFDRDTVSLNAMFTLLDDSAHQHTWALQLWACPTEPASAADLTGHLIAEAALPPMGEIADDAHSFEISVPALVPAGASHHVMVLALVSGQNRQFDRVHDLAIYSRCEQFVQPCLRGTASFCIDGNEVRLSVDQIENPRHHANLSGTLALELWAVSAPYTGGAFTGTPLAGVAIGELAGQKSFVEHSFLLPYTAPAPGTWHIALMLREWTAAGYVTRDFVNFQIPFTVAPPEPEAPAPVVTSSVPSPVPARRQKPAPKTDKISINKAKLAELVAVKGLPTKVAEGIVKKRPFASLDELQNVKGMGPKLLAKLRDRLKL